MGPAVPIETIDKNSENGKIYERSQQDGEMYSKPTVGIIYPPPEVRNIVDRTSNFVARNGPDFEERIRENEADNPKFNFLNPNDPYHAYYAHKLKEFQESDLSEPPPAALLEKETPKQIQPKKQLPQVIETIIPKDPPPAYEFTADPPTISAIDLDIVKLTAQFVAKNGKGFLTNLMTREQRNYQFDFLRPQHSLFQYFTRLVEQYTKVLLPPGDITQKLSKDLSDPWKILDHVKYRVEWQQYQDREKRKVEDEKERERIAFAQIDWHDFVVVETVNFREDETANLPPPVTKDQLGARILQQERIEKMKKSGEVNAEEIEMDVEDEEEESQEELYQPFQQEEQEKAGSDMEEESDEEKEETPAPPPMMPPPPAAATGGVTIRKYDPKAVKQAPTPGGLSEQFLISPLTGEKVPVENMAAHMKISLLDPRWKEQKEKAIEEKRQQEQVFAEGVHIGDTLKQLAERRSDIFGVSAEETLIGQKLGEEGEGSTKKTPKEIWDGHTASIERATKLAHSNITFEDQIKAIHKSKGLLPSDDAERIGPSMGPPMKPPRPSVEPTPPPQQRPPPQRPPPQQRPPPMQNTSPAPTITINPSDPGPKPQPPPKPLMSSAPPMEPPRNMPPRPPPGMMPPPRPPTGGPPMMPPPGDMGPMMQPPPLMPPPPGMLMPPGQMMPPPPHMQHQGMDEPPMMMPPPPQLEEEEPVSKKAKMDSLEADLVPEQIYLNQNPHTVTFRVQVPDLPEKSEWQCQGQVLSVSMPLSDPCSVIKAKISSMIGMPSGKQKLQLGTFFIKDSNSLAFYNFSSASLLQLQVKERGGRKK